MNLAWIHERKPELEEEARKCKTKDELQQLAIKNGIKLTDKELNNLFNFFHREELVEDELDLVAGGSNKRQVRFENKYTPSQITADNIVFLTNEEANKALENGEKNLYLDPNSSKWYKLV